MTACKKRDATRVPAAFKTGRQLDARACAESGSKTLLSEPCCLIQLALAEFSCRSVSLYTAAS